MKHFFKITICLFFLISFSWPGVRQGMEQPDTAVLEDSLKHDPENKVLLLKLAIQYHNLALRGDKDATEKAEDVLHKLLKLDSLDAEAYCWLGSLLTIKGRDAWLPVSKVIYVNDGIEALDKAVKLAPQNISIRLVRANNSLSLPGFFNRLDTAIVDFEYVAHLREKNSFILSDTVYADVLFNLGLALEKRGNEEQAINRWNQVIKLDADSQRGKEAKAKLVDLRGSN